MTLLLTFIIMLVQIGAMAIGVLVGGKPIAGASGGLRQLSLAALYGICGGDRNRCKTPF